MLDIVRMLLDWPRNEKGELIFRNTHDAYFYATMVFEMKELAEYIEPLLEIAKIDLQEEREKPAPNQTRMIYLARKHQFYSECIDSAKILFMEEGR